MLLKIFLMFLSLFILEHERETECKRGRVRDSGRHRIKAGSRLGAVNTELNVGRKPTNREIMTHELKLDAELTEQPMCSHHHALF